MGSEVEVYYGQQGAPVVNATSVDMGAVAHHFADNQPVGPAWNDDATKKVMDALTPWIRDTRPKRFGGIFDRDRFVSPDTYFGQVRTARKALRDDVVGGAADNTEAMAYSAIGVYCEDVDQEDVWNQWAADVDLDSRLREGWRLLLSDSQWVMAAWWGRKTYTPRGTGEGGRPRRAQYDLLVPTALTYLDSLKIAPVGTLAFNREWLAYIATPDEAGVIDRMLRARDLGPLPLPAPQNAPTLPTYGAGLTRWRTRGGDDEPVTEGIPLVDPIVERLIMHRYAPSMDERIELMSQGVDCDNLFLLDPRYVFRHTLTRPAYQRWPDVRMEKVFDWLDLKHQLKAMDRAFLIGGTNYIVLVTKGSDKIPAQPEEIANLRAQVHTIAQVPLVVGDHRLDIKIVTPALDKTLDQTRYDTIDNRLMAASYGTFVPTGKDSSDPTKLGRVIGRGLESRRRMNRRNYELNLMQRVRDNNPVQMTQRAKLMFKPASISLSFDQAWASFLLDLREAKEISRDTILSQFDLDQADEARQREREAEEYDDIFGTIVPHGANPAAPGNGNGADPANPTVPTRLAQRSGGRRNGGLRNGGGSAPGTGQGQEPVNPRRTAAMEKPELLELAKRLEIVGRSKMKKAELITAIDEALLDELEADDE